MGEGRRLEIDGVLSYNIQVRSVLLLIPSAVFAQPSLEAATVTLHDATASHTPHSVVDFWKTAGPKRWFAKNDTFDATFRDRFYATHLQAARRELEGWLDSAEGALALLILLDQFPRNAFRGTAHMFATDPLARLYAQRLLDAGLDQQVEPALRAFCYLPFEHSEDPADQQRSLDLNQHLDASTYHWAKEHARIIKRFGRFPHRNAVLARVTTAEEQTFLDAGGFAG